MQINGYGNALSLSSLKVQNKTKADGAHELKTPKSTETESKKITETEEMEIFKKEIHKEIGDIYANTSSVVLSNAVHITDGAFERMKNDPEFKNEMMSILREDAVAALRLPYQVHITTTLDENGYSAYGASVYAHDSATTKSGKQSEADKKAEGAFFYNANYASKFSQKETDLGDFLLQKLNEQDLLRQTQQERNLLQQAQIRKTLIGGGL